MTDDVGTHVAENPRTPYVLGMLVLASNSLRNPNLASCVTKSNSNHTDQLPILIGKENTTSPSPTHLLVENVQLLLSLPGSVLHQGVMSDLLANSVQPLVGLSSGLVQLVPSLVQLLSSLLLCPLGGLLSVPSRLLCGLLSPGSGVLSGSLDVLGGLLSRVGELLTLLLSLLSGRVGGVLGLLTDGLTVEPGVLTQGLGVGSSVVHGDGTGSVRDGLAGGSGLRESGLEVASVTDDGGLVEV